MDLLLNANTTRDTKVKLFNANIVNVENDCYFPPQVSLVIQNGKIIAMPGLQGEPDDYPADIMIDLHGLTIIPGLFNTHCHLQLLGKSEFREQQIYKCLSDCLDRGVTNIRDTLCYDIGDNQRLIEKIAHGEIQGPRIHQAIHIGPLGDTYAPRQTLKTRLLYSLLSIPTIPYKEHNSGIIAFRPNAGAQEVRDAVNRAIDERGAAAIKFCDQKEHFMTYKPGATVITAKQLDTAVNQCKNRGIPTTIHNVSVAGFRQAAGIGVTSLAHLPIDDVLTEADISLLLQSETFIEPTLTVGYYMSYSLKGSPVAGHPEIQRLDKFRGENYNTWLEESWLPELLKFRSGQHEALQKGEIKIFGFMDLTEPFRYFSKYIPVGGRNLQKLVEYGAGRRLGIGNDAGATNCSAASVCQELRMLDFILNKDGVQRFSAADALRTATIQSARSMGIEAQFGSIKPGKTADLAVLDGDPLKDYSLIGKPVQALFIEGKLVVNRCGLQSIHIDALINP